MLGYLHGLASGSSSQYLTGLQKTRLAPLPTIGANNKINYDTSYTDFTDVLLAYFYNFGSMYIYIFTRIYIYIYMYELTISVCWGATVPP